MRRHEHAAAWVWALAVLAIAGGASAAPRPRPGARPVSPPGNPMTLAELRALAASVGFPDPGLAAAVAMAESGGNAYAVGDGGSSFGLWQIHSPSHPEFDASRLLDPNYNAHAALLISKSGGDWSPWTTYRTGAYQQYMGGAA
jgi:Lysozyme like domain